MHFDATYSRSSALFDIPNSDFEINLALRARSVWHLESDRGDILRRDAAAVTFVTKTFFSMVAIIIFDPFVFKT
jgi:hypothetical protein